MQYQLVTPRPSCCQVFPQGIHLITRLQCSVLRLAPTTTSADFSQFVVTAANEPSVRPHGISHQSFLVYLPDLHAWVTVAIWTLLPLASSSARRALYQVPVRQATISLSLLLAYTSRCKPWESLWGSLATTPHVDFHHRPAACPPYLETCAARRTKDKSKEHPVSGMPFPLLYSVFVRFDRKYGFTFSKSHTKAMHFQNSAFTRPLRYPVQFRSISQMLLYRRQFRFRGSSLRCFLSDIPKDLLRT